MRDHLLPVLLFPESLHMLCTVVYDLGVAGIDSGIANGQTS